MLVGFSDNLFQSYDRIEYVAVDTSVPQAQLAKLISTGQPKFNTRLNVNFTVYIDYRSRHSFAR